MTGATGRYRTPALWSLLVGALVGSVWLTGFTPSRMRTWGDAWTFVRGMFPPDWSVLPEVLTAMVQTIAIAFLGTFLAFALAFPLSFLTARNLGPPWLGGPLRALMALARSVPEIIWAIVFVLATEFGNLPGVLAVAAHNLGILTKLIGEALEEAPIGPQEAVIATGAGRVQMIWFGMLPEALPAILTHAFFRFECAIRTATVLGVVGAGGVGTALLQHMQLYMYRAISVDVLAIVALVLLADGLGAYVRRQVA